MSRICIVQMISLCAWVNFNGHVGRHIDRFNGFHGEYGVG